MNNHRKNSSQEILIVMGLSIVILMTWQYFFGFSELENRNRKAAASVELQSSSYETKNPPIPEIANADSTLSRDIGSPTSFPVTHRRVTIDTPYILGSINLVGASIDDASLKLYREEVDPDSNYVRILSPKGTKAPYYTDFGWIIDPQTPAKLPDQQTEWTIHEGNILTPETPVTLAYDNDQGLLFRRTFSIDAQYMVTVSDTVLNTGEQAVSLYPYSAINLHGTPDNQGSFLLHEGIVGFINETDGLFTASYQALQDTLSTKFSGKDGWLGITDKYWAVVLIPEKSSPYNAQASGFPDHDNFIYQTSFLHKLQTITPGTAAHFTTRLFVGAKEVDTIDAYENRYMIPKFELLVDWGLFYFITKPLFLLVHFFYEILGNLGLSIICVTVLIKTLLFPLAYKSYKVAAQMKALQPELVRIRDEHANDAQKQREAIINFYKDKKLNPAAGCLPMIAQVPVFFALYKVLFITTEMRHAPFFGWIQDLAAPDPTNLFSLFGLLPWDPAMIPGLGHLLHIGIWPLVMGVTMFIQMRLSTPPATDETQARILQWMPVLFTFILASFPAGLVIYWTSNNIFSIIQQLVIMRRYDANPQVSK